MKQLQEAIIIVLCILVSYVTGLGKGANTKEQEILEKHQCKVEEQKQ